MTEGGKMEEEGGEGGGEGEGEGGKGGRRRGAAFRGARKQQGD